MKEVSDGFDILVAVVAFLFILTVGIWSIASVRSNMDVQVDEKMVAHNTFGQEIVRPVQTAKDALMSLVVNDAYVPDPVTVVFQYGRETYTVAFDNAYFKDKEESINKAWDSFFKDKMDLKVESVTLDPSGTRWVVKLIP